MELIKKFNNGEEKVFEELVRRYQHKVFNTTYRMLGNPEDAGDLAQEAFIKAYQNLKSFRKDASFSTWLFRITTNLCRDELRKRYRTLKTESLSNNTDQEDSIPDSNYSPENQAVNHELKKEIQQQILNLPLEQKEIIILREFQDLSYQEIAEVLNISLGTVKSRLSRARKSLRENLGKIKKGGIRSEA